MEPILNELSIEPVAGVSADERMLTLVAALKALRGLGTSRTYILGPARSVARSRPSGG